MIKKHFIVLLFLISPVMAEKNQDKTSKTEKSDQGESDFDPIRDLSPYLLQFSSFHVIKDDPRYEEYKKSENLLLEESNGKTNLERHFKWMLDKNREYTSREVRRKKLIEILDREYNYKKNIISDKAEMKKRKDLYLHILENTLEFKVNSVKEEDLKNYTPGGLVDDAQTQKYIEENGKYDLALALIATIEGKEKSGEMEKYLKAKSVVRYEQEKAKKDSGFKNRFNNLVNWARLIPDELIKKNIEIFENYLNNSDQKASSIINFYDFIGLFGREDTNEIHFISAYTDFNPDNCSISTGNFHQERQKVENLVEFYKSIVKKF